MLLDIGKHSSLIPTTADQSVHVIEYRAFKLAFRSVTLVLEPVEINQRCNEVVALPEEGSHLVRQSRYGDIATNRDRPRFNSLGAKVPHNQLVDELFFS